MRQESWIDNRNRKAAEKVEALLQRPLPTHPYGLDDVEDPFDPWDLFPCLYGTYSGEFDQCAIEILNELRMGQFHRDDLGAYMFREMLCTADLCTYGTSPRTCFPTTEFRPLVSRLMVKWKAYSLVRWEGEDVAPSVRVVFPDQRPDEEAHLRR